MIQNSRALHITKILSLVAMVALGSHQAYSQEPNGECCEKCGCEEGGKFVEVTQTRCKMVAEKVPVKKKVYECKEVPYCEHALPGLGKSHCCPKCEACGKTKTVLIKKEIKCGEKTEMKCVTEEVKVLVPVPCPKCGHRCSHRHGHHPHLFGQNDADTDEPSMMLASAQEDIVVDVEAAKRIRLASAKKASTVRTAEEK